MPARLEWLLENHIAYETFSGEVTLEEVQTVVQQGKELMQQNPNYTIHFVIDGRTMTKYPNLIALRKVNFRSTEKNQGFAIQIAPKGIFQFLTTTISQWFGIRMYFRDTFPEAIALLVELDPTLPDLSTLRDPLADSKV